MNFMCACLLAVLFGLAAGDEGGSFYITHKTSGKSWKVVLNNSTNSKKLANFVSEKNQVTLQFLHTKISPLDYLVWYDNDKFFNFTDKEYDFGEVDSQPYDLLSNNHNNAGTHTLIIVLAQTGSKQRHKLGHLENGKNELSELYDTVKSDKSDKKTFIISSIEINITNTDPSEDLNQIEYEFHIWLIPPLFFIFLLLLLILYLYCCVCR